MKKTAIYLILLCALTTILSACGKKDCGYAATGPVPFVIELRDNQGRDLLDPATPGHYDTTEIKSLNGTNARVKPVGYPYLVGNKDRIRLLLNVYYNSPTLKLRLSNTVTDDLVASFTADPHDCYILYNISAFTYNGVAYQPSDKQYYIIKKDIN